MIRRQSLIALGIAIVLGLLAVYFANIFLSRSEQRAEVASVGTMKIAVAAVPLDYGVEITPEKVRFVDFPNSSIPPGSYRNFNELLPLGKKRVAIRPIQVNEPILASKLTGEGQNASLAALLPDGKRAAAVRINDVSGVAGFIQPNDSVDVLITRETGGDRGAQITDVLLQNIRVIAIDQNAKDANGQPVLGRTATLELSPLDAQKIALAQQVGSLSLVLRKPGEGQNNPLVETVSLGDLRYSLYGGARFTPAAPAGVQQARPRVTIARAPVRRVRRPVSTPRPATSSVEIIRGTQGSNYEVGGYGS
jgi:pilus assembly protein CpaB